MKLKTYTTGVIILFIIICCKILNSYGAIFVVGEGRDYSKPSQVSALVNDGDTVYIDSGVYEGDVCVWTKNNLLIRAVGGYAHLKAAGAFSQGKAIWVVQGNNTTIEYIEFSECKVPDHNGAGIRQEGAGLTIRYCYFHNNENGILAGNNEKSDILIEYSHFAENGYGDGYTHNFYINHINSLTVRYCYIVKPYIGHCIKSRAYNNYILYNRIMDENDGRSSYLIDMPNGGYSIIIGNILMKGHLGENNTSISYGMEGLTNPVNKIYIVNNTFVSERHLNVFVRINDGTVIAKLINNFFAGIGNIIDGKADTLHNLWLTNIADAHFNDINNYDYTLTIASAAIDAGIDPGFADTLSLSPIYEYKHPCDKQPREIINLIDIGAFEYYYETGLALLDKNIHKCRNYPNPFINYTVFTFSSLSNNCDINSAKQFRLFNSNNSLVRTCDIKQTDYFIFYKDNLKSGIYFYEIIGSHNKSVKGKINIY